ncbi:hypothetical protein P43SY_003688 [Pythium insidiosum]|uniref:Uncharacterized protein n=1 Tax=Pythium insidiosum TaxID=114742 RepID=A0AAD5M091_PYTIN|nr:hypothetical protein P43SY_003688 [Pythium insidiosum]
MELQLLEAREAELRRRVLGEEATPTQRQQAYPVATFVERLTKLNQQLSRLNASIVGAAKLADLYDANAHLLELQRRPSTSISALQSTPCDQELQRAVVLSSEDHIDRVVTAFQRLRELQQCVAQLEQLRTQTPTLLRELQTLEARHSVQEERALVLHARIEHLLCVYQEMISSFAPASFPSCRGDRAVDRWLRARILDHVTRLLSVLHIQVLSSKCVDASAVLDQLLPQAPADHHDESM